jgi:hypothetical protein
MVVCIEVRCSRLLLENIPATGVNHRFAQAFGVSCLPVGAPVLISQFGNEKPALPNLDTKPVVNEPSRLLLV